MLELLLVRHGQTEWNTAQKVMGRQPVPLNDAGRAQSQALGNYLKNARLRAVISSPVLRAKQTAEILASFHKGIGVEEDEGLAEIDYGDWINLSFAELAEHHGETLRRYRLDPGDLVLPGGESMQEVVGRVADTIERIKGRFDDGRVALVAHADIIKLALLNLLGLELKSLIRFSVDNCSMILVRFYPEIGPRMVLYNSFNGFGKDL